MWNLCTRWISSARCSMTTLFSLFTQKSLLQFCVFRFHMCVCVEKIFFRFLSLAFSVCRTLASSAPGAYGRENGMHTRTKHSPAKRKCFSSAERERGKRESRSSNRSVAPTMKHAKKIANFHQIEMLKKEHEKKFSNFLFSCHAKFNSFDFRHSLIVDWCRP